MKVLRDDDNGVDIGIQIIGSKDEQELAERMIRDLTEDHTRSESDYPERRMPPAGALIVKVPSSCVGRIIGRGGAKIAELQEKSGARIRVPRDDGSGYEVDVQITGEPEKQKAAETLIKELLDDNPYNSSASNTAGSTNNVPDEDPSLVDWTAVIKNSVTLFTSGHGFVL